MVFDLFAFLGEILATEALPKHLTGRGHVLIRVKYCIGSYTGLLLFWGYALNGIVDLGNQHSRNDRRVQVVIPISGSTVSEDCKSI